MPSLMSTKAGVSLVDENSRIYILLLLNKILESLNYLDSVGVIVDTRPWKRSSTSSLVQNLEEYRSIICCWTTTTGREHWFQARVTDDAIDSIGDEAVAAGSVLGPLNVVFDLCNVFDYTQVRERTEHEQIAELLLIEIEELIAYVC